MTCMIVAYPKTSMNGIGRSERGGLRMMPEMPEWRKPFAHRDGLKAIKNM